MVLARCLALAGFDSGSRNANGRQNSGAIPAKPASRCARAICRLHAETADHAIIVTGYLQDKAK
jgi:hypothetical protein